MQYAIDSQLELAEPLSGASHTRSDLNQARQNLDFATVHGTKQSLRQQADAMPVRDTAEPSGKSKSLGGLFVGC